MRFAIGAAIERNMILTALIDRVGNAFGEKCSKRDTEYSTFSLSKINNPQKFKEI